VLATFVCSQDRGRASGDHAKVRVEAACPWPPATICWRASRRLLPLLTGIQASGTFALDTLVELDTRRPADTGALEDARRLSDHCTSEALSPPFQQPWEREVLGADGRKMTIQSGPGTPTWVPRATISNYLETAVLICEDGGFFGTAASTSEAMPTRCERTEIRVPGARRKHISMQVAKNVYLPGEDLVAQAPGSRAHRSSSRSSPRADPGALFQRDRVRSGHLRHRSGGSYYFDTTPDRLSLGQALFLGSILPNPKRQHFGPSASSTRAMRVPEDAHADCAQAPPHHRTGARAGADRAGDLACADAGARPKARSGPRLRPMRRGRSLLAKRSSSRPGPVVARSVACAELAKKRLQTSDRLILEQPASTSKR